MKRCIFLIEFVLCLQVADSLLICYKLISFSLVLYVYLNEKLIVNNLLLLNLCKHVLINVSKTEKLCDI